MATKTEITATAIFKITSKIDGTTCWMVPSDTQPGVFYKTCYDEQAHFWTCTCKHGEIMAERNQASRCKHQRAAQTSILANKAQAAHRRAQEVQMAALAEEMLAAPSQRASREALPLNGNRPFSLLK